MAEPKVRFKQDNGNSFPEYSLKQLSDCFYERNEKASGTEELLAVTQVHGVIMQSETDKRNVSNPDKSNYKVVKVGDIAYNSMRMWQGAEGVSSHNGIVSPAYTVIYSKNADIHAFYFEKYFKTKRMLKVFERNSQGITSDTWNLKFPAFSRIFVNVPCKEEQQKIADFLASVDEIIDASEQEVTNLETQKKAVMKKIFSQEIRFKKKDGSDFSEWQKCYRLKEVSDFITKGATPTTYGYDWVVEGIPFFRNDAIRDNTFVYGDFSYISEKAHSSLIRSEIKSDDILVAITGEIGKVGMVPKGIERGNINQHIARVRINREFIPYFVYQYLCSDVIQKNYKKIKTGLSMAQLSLEQIRNTEIPIVDLEEQRLVADFLSSFDEAIAAAKKELELWKELKKGLLQKMFV